MVWRSAAKAVGRDSKPRSDAKDKIASVPVTTNPSCRATVVPSRSSISRAAACSSCASAMAADSPGPKPGNLGVSWGERTSNQAGGFCAER